MLKRIHQVGLVLAALASGSIAHASYTIALDGSQFHPRVGPDFPNAAWGGPNNTGQMFNYAAAPTLTVVASIPHFWDSVNNAGYTVYFDGVGGNGINCALNVHDFFGNSIGYYSVKSAATTGSWESRIDLNAGQTPVWAYFTAECWLPPNPNGVPANGILTGATVTTL